VFETVVHCVGFAFGIIPSGVSVNIKFSVFRVNDLKMQLMFAETPANLYFYMRYNPESEPTCWSLIIKRSVFALDITGTNVYKRECTEVDTTTFTLLTSVPIEVINLFAPELFF